MNEKLIPNRYLKLYLSFKKKRDSFTIFDIVQIMEEDLEPTDKLFSLDIYYEGIRDEVFFDLKRFIYSWYEKDKIFARQFRNKISKSEEELASYLEKLNSIRKNHTANRLK